MYELTLTQEKQSISPLAKATILCININALARWNREAWLTIRSSLSSIPVLGWVSKALTEGDKS